VLFLHVMDGRDGTAFLRACSWGVAGVGSCECGGCHCRQCLRCSKACHTGAVAGACFFPYFFELPVALLGLLEVQMVARVDLPFLNSPLGTGGRVAGFCPRLLRSPLWFLRAFRLVCACQLGPTGDAFGVSICRCCQLKSKGSSVIVDGSGLIG